MVTGVQTCALPIYQGQVGYQYASFSNLPLISEGRMSILANMLLLGMIVSAYRFDRVVDDGIWDLRNAEG